MGISSTYFMRHSDSCRDLLFKSENRSRTYIIWKQRTLKPEIADSRRVVVSYKRKYVHEVLINGLVKLAKEKSVVMWTDRPDMFIAVGWDVKSQTKQENIRQTDPRCRKEET